MNKNRYISLDDLEEINKQNEQMKKNNKKYKKERKSIFEKFSTKENIIIFSFLLIFLIIASVLIKKYNPYDKIDYRNVNISTFLNNSEKLYDREKYWILNDILLSFLYSNADENIGANGEGVESNLYYKYSTEEYYEALTDDYKIFLKKDKYLEKANKIIEEYEKNYECLHTVSSEVPIRSIYKINDLNGEYYIVRLNATNNIYIGIQLFSEDSRFRIFYLE